jgi:hypothetical protein
MASLFKRCLGLLLGAVLWAAGAGSALAFTEGVFVGSTLEGCRNNQGSTPLITLPIGGQYKCPDTAYVTGNFSHWFELDLVPHRLTTSVGNQAAATTDYDVYIAGDGITSGKLGWDVITEPVVNTAKSDASCTVSAGPQLTLGTPTTPFGGGTDTVIYRQLTIHQNKGSTCVFDWVQRLALGSHLYSGSSLQSYLAVQEGLSGSKKTISLAVEENQAQALNKDMAASQGTDHTWNLTKSPTTNTLPFGDVCAKDAVFELPVQITVSWTKSAAIAGQITVTTNVYAMNPANRVITTTVTDVIYSGTTVLDTSAPVTKDVPANTTNFLMLTHNITVPSGTTQLNDVATATYTDLVTQVPIPGSTTATASAPVQQTGPELNASAVITDLEQISGTGLTYSVATPSLGGFLGYPLVTDPAYLAGTQTSGFVNWGTTSQPGTGSVTFDKKVHLAAGQITTGTLMDSASLVGSSGYEATAGPVKINISSTATATLKINKSYKGLTIGAGEKLVFNFKVASTTLNPAYSADTSITLNGGGSNSGSVSLSGLMPDTYSVLEGDTFFYPAGCDDASCRLTVAMTDPNGLLRTVNLQPVNGIATCSGAATYANEPNRGTFPTAQVKKITVPNTSSGSWSFTLLRSDGTTAGTAVATANASTPNNGYADFGVSLDEGTYTVVETEQTPEWVLTGASPNNGSATKICSFAVNLPQDAGKVFQCAFTNTQQSKVRVEKTASKLPLKDTNYAFEFQLRAGASMTAQGNTLATGTANASNGGAIDFSPYLTPGATYQICEVVMPGWSTNLAGDEPLFVPESVIPPSLPNPNVNNMTVCADFKVQAGLTRTFTVDNSPPPGGRALTIGFWKNWASCKKSGGNQKPVLDQTMAKAEPTGIQVDSFYLHGSALTPDKAPDCAKAVNLLSKQNFKGVNKASDPLFNMAAQLVAAELNQVAGAYSCPLVVAAIGKANALLTKYSFNGTSYTGKLSAVDATDANNYAKRLDDYNNNRASACQ